MCVLVLVSGPFTDERIWSGVTGPLRESGAEVRPVRLDARPEADLETHVGDVLRVIDAVDEPQVVLVGHDYAIHPVLAAADRRPARVSRIVYLDAGLPKDGDTALALVRDPAVHQLLRREGDFGQSLEPAQVSASEPHPVPEPVAVSAPEPVPVPEPGQWQRWGSTEGLSAGQLELLSALAAPQPARTLTQPLRLTGAAADVPTTGILCTAGGTTIETVQALVRVGPPEVRALADPGVGFFELATGHWPMLSCPDELAAVLVRAAAGEGRRLAPPEEVPASRPPFLLDVPERPWVRTGRVDLHLPGTPDGPRPAVLFVHGGPVPRDQVPGPRDTPFYRGYARLVASLGAVGAVVEHRLHGINDYARAAQDLAEGVEVLRADPRVDPDRIALWIFSGGGLLAARWLTARPAWLRCVALTYPILEPLPGWGAVGENFDVVATMASDGGGSPPIVLTRAGRETPQIAATVERFVAAATRAKAPVEIVDVPNGAHGFETDHPDADARAAVERAARAVVRHLGDCHRGV